jgi:formylglycine-generating enzyme required for sulfatase activity
MRKNIILTLIMTSLLLTLLLVSGCEDKKSTNVEEILDKDVVEVLLIDDWDLWEMQVIEAPAAKSPVAGKDRGISRDGEMFPVLVEEFYASIEPHKIMINSVPPLNLDPSTDESIEGLHMENSQLWVEDIDENITYYYDYYYNESSGALWLHEETTSDTVWAVDPLEVDSLGVPIYDVNEFTLLFKYEKGPSLDLIQPADDWIVPDPENEEIDDLTPKFKWSQYIGPGEEYTFQLRKDELFDETTGFIYNEVLTSVNFTPSVDLDNFENYYWRVKASISDWSEIWNFVTKEVVLLSAPTDNSYLGLKPTFKWDNLNGATNYTLQLTQDVNFDTILLEETSTVNRITPDSNLEPNVEYFWKVKGDNSGDHWSEIWSFTTSGRINVANAVPDDEKMWVPVPVEFDWNDFQNSTIYEIEIAEDSLFTNVVSNSTMENSHHVANDLLEDEIYYWRVKSDVVVDWSDTLKFHTNTVVVPYSPEHEAVDVGVVCEFKWHRFNGNESSYFIEVSDDSTFVDPIVNARVYFMDDEIYCTEASLIEIDEDDTDIINFIPELIEDFTPETKYYWRIKHRGADWSDTWELTTIELSATTTDLTEPTDALDNVVPLAKFKWTATGSAEFYRLQVSTSETFDSLVLNKVVTANNYTLLNDENVNEMLFVGETYYWRARSDRTEMTLPWSFVVRTGIPYDVEIVCIPETPNKVDISWDCLDGQYTDFFIERSDDNGTTWERLDSVPESVTDYVDFGLDLSTTYLYRLKSKYPLGFSDYTEDISVTTEDFVLDNDPNLVTVTSGDFSMGSSTGDADEAPVHTVTLNNAFEIGQYEITNAEFCEILNWALGKGMIVGIAGYGANAIYLGRTYNLEDLLILDESDIDFSSNSNMFKPDTDKDNYPVKGVSFLGAAYYCNWLSTVKSLNTLYTGASLDCTVYGSAGYRLPTEAEWEYTATNEGNDSFTYSGSNAIADVAWYIGNANGDTNPVGELTANGLETKDMSGNVWEWCNDWYGADYYASSPDDDPIGPSSNPNGDYRVIRGGSWEYDESFLRNTNRSYALIDLSNKVSTSIGFRVVKIVP